MRRIALLATIIGFLSLGRASAQGLETDPPSFPKFRVYVGTYTGKGSKGIYRLDLDTKTGKLGPVNLVAETPSPSFLAIHPSRKFLYAANEVGKFMGSSTGSVTAFAIDAKTGGLIALNAQPSGGADPCWVTVDVTGSNVLVANYSGGSVEVLPVGKDGKLGKPTSVVQHTGSSVNKGRQSEPHAHSINLDAAGKFAVAADLGLDKLLVYKFDPEKGTLTPNSPSFARLRPGSGPRHFAFHPDTKHAYVINELTSSISAFDYDPSAGTLISIEAISTRPPGAPANGNSTAEIVVHPSGRFLYGSNRGDDALAIYTIDLKSGILTSAGFQATGGKTPRNFAIDPTGRFLIVANQDSSTLVLFRIDLKTGQLGQVGQPIPVPTPVCVRFVAVEG